MSPLQIARQAHREDAHNMSAATKNTSQRLENAEASAKELGKQLDAFVLSERLQKAAPALLDASRAVIAAWESGDLAGAVNRLQAAIHSATL